jgi:DNA-binding MarR family transcriptional regulator
MIAPSPLQAHLGYHLRQLSNHVSAAFARKLAARDVIVAEWVLLRLLLDAPAAPSSLAARMGLSKGAITKLAERLAARQLISRQASEEDRRSQTLSLTARGRKLVPELARLADENDAEFFSFYTGAERAQLIALLEKAAARHGIAAPPVD